MSRLAELSSIYPNVKVCYLSVGIENNRLGFQYNLKEGYTDVPHYGVLLAEIAGMPPEVIQDAKRIAQKLDDQVWESLWTDTARSVCSVLSE
jgi:DNA mismatch repair protein MSH4